MSNNTIKVLGIQSIPIIREYVDMSDIAVSNNLKQYVDDKIINIGPGVDVINGISIFTSIVFTRSNETPAKPEGGNYDNPVPDGNVWSDAIPAGEAVLWSSKRVFASNGVEKPDGKQDTEWSEPVKMTDTADFEVIYSNKTDQPANPTSGFGRDEYGNILKEWWEQNKDNWTDQPDVDSIWMATNTAKNGVWNDKWNISKIKGEKGVDGKDGDNIEFIYLRSKTEQNLDSPENSQENNFIPGGWSDRPQGVTSEWVYEYFSMRKKSGGVWSDWSEPSLWSKYGENGQDGDGVQYIYCRNNGEKSPANPTPIDWETNEDYQNEDGEYISKDTDFIWYDNPQGVNETNQYEWVAVRKYKMDESSNGKRRWQKYSDPAVWAKYGKNGEQGPAGPQGPAGADGALGKTLYPAGVWNSKATYVSDENTAPYVIYDEEYYMLIADTSNANNPSISTTIWKKIEKFDAVYAKIAMIDNGTIGSAVYSGDYMFSKQGKNSSGEDSSTYSDFKALSDDELYGSGQTFKPNICMNFNTGKIWACCGNVNIGDGNIDLYGNISIGGDIVVNGFLKRKMTKITSSNYNNYTTTINNLTYLDITKTGTYIQIESLPSANNFEIWLPMCKAPYKSNAGKTDIDIAGYDLMRSLFGTMILIVNDTTNDLTIGARGPINGNNVPSGYIYLSKGYMQYYELQLESYSADENNSYIEFYGWQAKQYWDDAKNTFTSRLTRSTTNMSNNKFEFSSNIGTGGKA